MMKAAMIIKIVGMAYNRGFRSILINFINDPENEWDEKLILALDMFFGYTSKRVNN